MGVYNIQTPTFIYDIRREIDTAAAAADSAGM
jgi:hypothetical protein